MRLALCLSITSSFIFVAFGAAVYHAEYSFVQTAFPHKCSLCNVLLVRFKASDVWYIINTGPTWKLPRYPVVAPCRPCGHDCTELVPSCTSAGYIWGRCWVVQVQWPGCISECLLSWSVMVNFPTPLVRGGYSFPTCGVKNSYLGQVQLFHAGIIGVHYPRAVRGQGQLREALYFKSWFNTWFTWGLIVTWEMDINADLSFGRTTYLDMAIKIWNLRRGKQLQVFMCVFMCVYFAWKLHNTWFKMKINTSLAM